jgi:hypothetical protein
MVIISTPLFYMYIDVDIVLYDCVQVIVCIHIIEVDVDVCNGMTDVVSW